MDIIPFSFCPSCGSHDREMIFSLGKMPPVNAFVEPKDVAQQKSFPLDLHYCKGCTLAHLGAAVSPEILFSNYLHMSSGSQGNIRHLNEVAGLILAEAGPEERILEVGSNDGTLLKLLSGGKRFVLGVDPAGNLADMANAFGVKTIVSFFDQDVAKVIRDDFGSFDRVIALNVVAHTPTFISMLQGIRNLLRPGGIFMMENAYVVDTILQGQFDTIYHEHVSNFSMHSLESAYRRVGLVPIRAEIIPTQGTSIRVWCSRAEDAPAIHPSVWDILRREKEKGFTDVARYRSTAGMVKAFKEKLQGWLRKKREEGTSVVGLGAPARGVVLLNYCEVGPESLSYVIDDTPLKQGRLIPGRGIEVASWDRLKERPEEAFLLLSWNYKNDLLARLRQTVPKGIVLAPFPEFGEIRF